MTPKEAFRYECWIFHGKGPGKKKMEKRKKILNNLEKVKTTVPGESPLMKTLQYEQQKNKNAYMVISSKKN